MKSSSHLPRKIGLVAVLAAISVLAVSLLCSGKRNPRNPLSESQLAGNARLISMQPLPEMDGEMCEWVPASVSSPLSAALWQERMAVRGPTGTDESKRAEVAQRKPLRMIRDPYALYSAVAVDAVRNEVVLQDENLFRTLVYDRLADTPPGATMTEPKRIIGGLETELEFNCALYIDPKTGDIYSVNNDTVDSLGVFSRQAKGNVPPDRKLHTPHGAFGIAVDKDEQEMFLTIQHSNAVVVFPQMAEDEEPPGAFFAGRPNAAGRSPRNCSRHQE